MILSAAVDNGQPGYPWLVFLHGFSGDRNEWRKVGDAFPAWPRLYLDLPGHGGSADIAVQDLSLIHISEPTRLGMISYAVFCLKKKKKTSA